MPPPEPYYQDDNCTIYHGDCAEILPLLGKVDAIVTDPPYGIGESSKKTPAEPNHLEAAPPRAVLISSQKIMTLSTGTIEDRAGPLSTGYRIAANFK